MKKIIKNKVYDTDKAKIVGSYSLESGTAFDYWEDLYQKRTGEYFLHGQGNSRSKYAITDQFGDLISDEKIIPFSYESAKEWALEYMSPEDYNKIFGEGSDNNTKMQVCISLSAKKYDEAKKTAHKLGMNISSYIESLI